jgi:hypothetical protein
MDENEIKRYLQRIAAQHRRDPEYRPTITLQVQTVADQEPREESGRFAGFENDLVSFDRAVGDQGVRVSLHLMVLKGVDAVPPPAATVR